MAYRETITRSAAAEYQHKKQTGGHGQYAKVEITIKPLPRGEQFSFVNQTVGGAISKGYIPGVEKGLREGMAGGVLAGFPVVDVEIALVDGKEHSVDSSELAFSLAARGALRSAIDQARPALLEPVANLTVFVEEGYLGDVCPTDSRAGAFRQEPIDGRHAGGEGARTDRRVLRYAIDLKSMTSALRHSRWSSTTTLRLPGASRTTSSSGRRRRTRSAPDADLQDERSREQEVQQRHRDSGQPGRRAVAGRQPHRFLGRAIGHHHVR